MKIRVTVDDSPPPAVTFPVLPRRPVAACPLTGPDGRRCRGGLYGVPLPSDEFGYAGDWRRSLDWGRHLKSKADLFCPVCGHAGTRMGREKIPAALRPYGRVVHPKETGAIPMLREVNTVWWPMGVDFLRGGRVVAAVKLETSEGKLTWRVSERRGGPGRPKSLGSYSKFDKALRFERQRMSGGKQSQKSTST